MLVLRRDREIVMNEIDDGGATWGISSAAQASAAAKQQDLPGAWEALYDSIADLNKSELRLVAIETFVAGSGFFYSVSRIRSCVCCPKPQD